VELVDGGSSGVDAVGNSRTQSTIAGHLQHGTD
jgi:hypothetical protein